MTLFGNKYTAEFVSSYYSVQWRCVIAERGYSGSVSEMLVMADPLTIGWDKKGDDFFASVKGSEATLNVMCTRGMEYISLFTNDPRRYRMTVYRNDVLFWQGYVAPDTYSESFAPVPYEVQVKAIDGFSLLSNLPYVDASGQKITGRKSLWQVLHSCLGVLELDLVVSDWLDLYAEGMDEASSPLAQAYIDMDRVYAVRSEPTYRDMLDMCLMPFCGQIFQSLGAIHIRRIASLASPFRPLTFFSGRADRPIHEDAWAADTYLLDSCSLEILPALKSLSVDVSNKKLDNIAGQIGWFDRSKWSTEYIMIDPEAKSIRMTADPVSSKEAVHAGYPFKQSSSELALKFKAGFMYRGRSFAGKEVSKFMLKITAGGKTNYFNGDEWVADEYIFSDSIRDGEETVHAGSSITNDYDFSIPGIPFDGKLIFCIYNTSVDGGSAFGADVIFSGITLSMQVDDNDSALKYTAMLDSTMNKEMAVTLPLADIPNVPNADTIYQLYFSTSDGKTTHNWHSSGKSDYRTLVQHVVATAVKLRLSPSWTISGPVTSRAVIDLNTVIVDSNYTNRLFYTNAVELNAVDDSFDVEFIAIERQDAGKPEPGDDCVRQAVIPERIKSTVRTEQYIFMIGISNALYRYDTNSRKISVTGLAFRNYTGIFPGERSVCIVETDKITAIDSQGRIILSTANAKGTRIATYSTPDVYKDEATATSGYYIFSSPATSYRRGSSALRQTIKGGFESFVRNEYEMVINTDVCSYHYDKRVNSRDMTLLDYRVSILSASDRLLLMHESNALKIYGRNSLSIADKTLIDTIGGNWRLADQNSGLVAFTDGSACKTWSRKESQTTDIVNRQGASEKVIGLFYVNGELLIVRETGVYVYCGMTEQTTVLGTTPSAWVCPITGENRFTFLKNGEVFTFPKADDYAVILPASLTDYVTVKEKGRDGFTLSVASPAMVEVSDNIAVRELSTGLAAIVNITLKSDVLVTVSPLSLLFDKDGETKDLSVVSNSTWRGESDQAWCGFAPGTDSGIGNGIISAVATSNESGYTRTATIKITCGSQHKSIGVTQLGQDVIIEPDKTTYYISDKEQSLKIGIETNVGIIASCQQEWCRVGYVQNGAQAVLTAGVDRNISHMTRNADVHINGAGIIKAVRIVQDGSISFFEEWADEHYAKLSGGNDFLGTQYIDGDLYISGTFITGSPGTDPAPGGSGGGGYLSEVTGSGNGLLTFLQTNYDPLTVDLTHSHPASQVTGLEGTFAKKTDIPTVFPWAAVTGKPTVFPADWATISGKPTVFPSQWSMVSGRPTALSQLTDDLNVWKSSNFTPASKLDAAQFTGVNILDSLKTVDGAGSGLDADTLDGYHADSFMRAEAKDGYWGLVTPPDGFQGWVRTPLSGLLPYDVAYDGAGTCYLGTPGYNFGHAHIDNVHCGTLNRVQETRFANGAKIIGNNDGSVGLSSSHGTFQFTGAGILGSLKTVDGAGSGLDADTLDGYHADSFMGNYIYTIDAAGLDQSTYYPVTIAIGPSSTVRISVIVSLNSGATPSWSTHAAGFSCRFVEEVNGDGWGINPVNRTILANDYAFALYPPIGRVAQMATSSTEVIWVRGGGRYYFWMSHPYNPVLRTQTYTINSLSVEPISNYGDLWAPATGGGISTPIVRCQEIQLTGGAKIIGNADGSIELVDGSGQNGIRVTAGDTKFRKGFTQI